MIFYRRCIRNSYKVFRFEETPGKIAVRNQNTKAADLNFASNRKYWLGRFLAKVYALFNVSKFRNLKSTRPRFVNRFFKSSFFSILFPGVKIASVFHICLHHVLLNSRSLNSNRCKKKSIFTTVFSSKKNG